MGRSNRMTTSLLSVKLQNHLQLPNGLHQGSPFALANLVTFTNAGPLNAS